MKYASLCSQCGSNFTHNKEPMLFGLCWVCDPAVPQSERFRKARDRSMLTLHAAARDADIAPQVLALCEKSDEPQLSADEAARLERIYRLPAGVLAKQPAGALIGAAATRKPNKRKAQKGGAA